MSNIDPENTNPNNVTPENKPYDGWKAAGQAMALAWTILLIFMLTKAATTETITVALMIFRKQIPDNK